MKVRTFDRVIDIPQPLTWHNIRRIIIIFSEVSHEYFESMSANEMCQETLRRFKEAKK